MNNLETQNLIPNNVTTKTVESTYTTAELLEFVQNLNSLSECEVQLLHQKLCHKSDIYEKLSSRFSREFSLARAEDFKEQLQRVELHCRAGFLESAIAQYFQAFEQLPLQTGFGSKLADLIESALPDSKLGQRQKRHFNVAYLETLDPSRNTRKKLTSAIKRVKEYLDNMLAIGTVTNDSRKKISYILGETV